MTTAWVRADISFAAFYSYRIPGLSPSYALTSPVPGPAALRLSLVDAAIQHTGSVSLGREILEAVKAAPLKVEPPDRVCVMKFFIKRLKPGKRSRGQAVAGLVESTGVREYCHFDGPMRVYMQLSEMTEEVTAAFSWLRRLGTTDSIVYCGGVTALGGDPPWGATWKEASALPPSSQNFAHRPAVTLNELAGDVTFDQVSPYSQTRRGNPYKQKVFLLPLFPTNRGQNWTLYEKRPFDLP